MKILEIEILTSDIKSAQEFYSKKLELEVISCATHQFSVQAGRSTITFTQAEKDIFPVYHFAFNIPNNQLNEGLEWISKRAELIPVEADKLIADFDNWNAKAFYFRDPLGNILECLTRFELNNQGSKPFKGHSLLCVSEIAVVTQDVPLIADQLHIEKDLPFFTKQPRHDNFTVMGDDHGLLILSEEDRHWYPTEELAKPFPVRARISDMQKVFTLSFNEKRRDGMSFDAS